MTTATKTYTPLRQYRLEIVPKSSQEDMSVRSGIRMQTYRRAECGEPICYSTAMRILVGINHLRSVYGGHRPLGLDDLGLNIV